MNLPVTKQGLTQFFTGFPVEMEPIEIGDRPASSSSRFWSRVATTSNEVHLPSDCRGRKTLPEQIIPPFVVASLVASYNCSEPPFRLELCKKKKRFSSVS